VSRRWLPWRRRRPTRDDISLPDAIDVDDPIAGLVFFVLFLVVLAVAPVVIVAFLVAIEFLLLLLLLPFAVLGRMLFGRKWHVELRQGWAPWSEELAGDWRGSTMKIHEIADSVRRGEMPERTLGVNATS
jgi:hypothetical protein